MKPLVREAACISRDFKTATFVGAVAVMLHTDEHRQSLDLDFVVAEQIPDDEFLGKGYRIDSHGVKFTPRGYKIDVYHERDLNGMRLEDIIKTAARITVDRKETVVNAISLERLVVAKFRAGRDLDIDDLKRLAIRCGSKIEWNEIRRLAKSNTEYTLIRQAIRLYTT